MEFDHSGGPHKLTVADIRNIVFTMRSNLWTLREAIEAADGHDDRTDDALSTLDQALTLLGQPDNTAELHEKWITCPD